MSSIYTVSFAGTVTNAGGDTDLCELTPADDKPIKLCGFTIGQYSEFGDTAEEAIRISVILLPATVTSGNGSATTPRPLDDLAAAAGFAAETNGTTVATTSGTALTLQELAWNLRASPYEFWFPDDEFMPTIRQASALVIRMQSTLADDISMAFTAYVKE